MLAVFKQLLAVAVVLICFEREAKAYTDPGSGALIWQVLVAGFFGALFYLRRILGWFRAKGQRHPEL